MRVRIMNTDLDGRPIKDEWKEYAGETSLDVVKAMREACLFSDQKTIEGYIDMVLRNTKMLAGIELTVKGDTPDVKASAFIDSLADHRLAEYVEEKIPAVRVPPEVWNGLEAVRVSGVTNMLDRPAVIEIARFIGYNYAASWIESHRGKYAHGIFHGFAMATKGKGGKS